MFRQSPDVYLLWPLRPFSYLFLFPGDHISFLSWQISDLNCASGLDGKVDGVLYYSADTRSTEDVT